MNKTFKMGEVVAWRHNVVINVLEQAHEKPKETGGVNDDDMTVDQRCDGVWRRRPCRHTEWYTTFIQVHMATETITRLRLYRRTWNWKRWWRWLPGHVQAQKRRVTYFGSYHDQTDIIVVRVYTPVTRDALDVILEGCCRPNCWCCRICHLCWTEGWKCLYI